MGGAQPPKLANRCHAPPKATNFHLAIHFMNEKLRPPPQKSNAGTCERMVSMMRESGEVSAESQLSFRSMSWHSLGLRHFSHHDNEYGCKAFTAT